MSNPPSSAWWDERYAATTAGRLWAASAPRVVLEVAAELHPGRALDVATGDGRTATALARQGWSVTAMDFSPVALQRAQTRPGAEKVAWELGDVHTWKPPGAFDLVIVAYLHLRDNQSALRRVSGWVAPGGTLLIVGHDETNPSHGGHGPTESAVLYSPQLLASVVGDEYTILRNETIHRDDTDHETAAGGDAGVDTVLRARRAG